MHVENVVWIAHSLLRANLMKKKKKKIIFSNFPDSGECVYVTKESLALFPVLWNKKRLQSDLIQIIKGCKNPHKKKKNK
jgi:hypothetical protein